MTPTATIYTSRVVVRAGDGASVVYSVDIDLTQLDQLAIKAASNKRRTGRAGPLTLRVVSIKPAGHWRK